MPGGNRWEIVIRREGNGRAEMLREVREGLMAPQKFLPSKYFYDSTGSALFELICRLPEYYQTRTELAILRAAAAEIMTGVSEGSVIELGPGSSGKIAILLDAVHGLLSGIRYVAVDVCEQALRRIGSNLLRRFPALNVLAVVADFHHMKDLLLFPGPKVIGFFGGTLGNLSLRQSSVFLRNIAEAMKPGDRFLVGMDLIKQRDVLEAAYNDSQGVTARFNKNILSVLQREIPMRLDLSAFDHLAFYHAEQERIEMHLRANRYIALPREPLGLTKGMGEGETIFTEMSRKFSRKKAEAMAGEAGLRLSRWFTDSREWFAIAEMVPA